MKILEVFSDIIINAGIANGFLIAILYSGHKKHNSHFLLSLLLIVISLIVFRIHYLTQYLLERFGSGFYGSGPFIFLLGPFLFFYLRSIVIPESTIVRKDLIHFVFFVIFFSIEFALKPNVCSSISANLGFASTNNTAFAVEIKEKDGTIISSSFPNP